jgi:hypothetical protein
MPRKRYKPEETVMVSQGRSIAESIRQIGMSEVTPIISPWTALPTLQHARRDELLDGASSARFTRRDRKSVPLLQPRAPASPRSLRPPLAALLGPQSAGR